MHPEEVYSSLCDILDIAKQLDRKISGINYQIPEDYYQTEEFSGLSLEDKQRIRKKAEEVENFIQVAFNR